jgi:nucleoside-diphosphate-sugar epimerase
MKEKKRVLVTGATGYIGSWLVKYLLEEGYDVTGSVRDKSHFRAQALLSLTSEFPGTIDLVEADLMETGSFDDAVKGCSVVFHTASPFKTKFTDARRELIDPALIGTKNVLGSVNKETGVKRVVLTSSIAAVIGDNKDLLEYPHKIADENCWNLTSSEHHNPYSFSKVLAERCAWELCHSQERWSLAVINPSLVIGPSCTSHLDSESFQIMKQYLSGAFLFGIADYSLGLVDVRDVAQAHLRAGFISPHQGRFIISAANTSLDALGQTLKANFPASIKFSRLKIPRLLIALAGRFISRAMTYRFVMNNMGYPWKANHQKSIDVLEMSYRSIEDSSREMIQQIIDAQRKS